MLPHRIVGTCDERRIRRACALVVAVLALGVHLTVAITVNTEFRGDELRYVDQAQRILEGVAVYPAEIVKNPPLYPLLLAGLLALGVPLAALKFSSVLASLCAALLLFSLVARVWRARWACALACLYVLYPPMILLGSQVMTEPLASLLLLLICRLSFGIRDVRRPGLARMVAAGALLAMLALFKPMFGYAAGACCCLAAGLWAIRAWGIAGFHRWAAGATLLAILLCAPYLAFIHSLTGSNFSWGTTGGEHFYWMSIGGEDVWGSWMPTSRVEDFDFLVENGITAEVLTADAMPGPEAQTYYARLAAERVRENPLHLVRNVFANAGRVLFNYPYSFRAQSLYTYGYLLPNMVLYLCLALSFAALPLTRRAQHPGLAAVILLAVVYLGGNILVGSTGRQGIVLLGPFLLWIAFQLRLILDAGWVVIPPPRD